jgi:hypothetical protein
MTKPPEKTRKPNQKPTDKASLELDPNAWPKFEKLIKSAAKMGHKPHTGTRKTAKGSLKA